MGDMADYINDNYSEDEYNSYGDTKCICTQLTALEPTVNPDCPIHGSMLPIKEGE